MINNHIKTSIEHGMQVKVLLVLVIFHFSQLLTKNSPAGT